MRKTRNLCICAAVVGATVIGGCARDPNKRGVTNPRQPGPAVGQAIGAGVGAVGGNVAGAVVGIGEGAATAAAKPFDSRIRVVRTWRTEVAADGRTLQVPVDTVVDDYGRPVSQPRPAKSLDRK